MITFLFIKDCFNFINSYNLILIFFFNLIILNTISIYFMKNPVYSLILLILNYSLVGFIFIFNGILFLGLIFILIYTGAISILLIFTLMLLNLRTIYFKSYNTENIYIIYAFIFFLEIISFIIINYNNKIFYFDDYIFINWKNYVEINSDFVFISKRLLLNNIDLIIICSLALTFILIICTSIVSTFKSTKKQEVFLQIKKYKKKIIN